MARHSFATTVTLEHDVPIETVSQMLGHRSIKTTQIYAKVTQRKVSNNMKDLKKRLHDEGSIIQVKGNISRLLVTIM
jgi:site-specific recombinase XerD